jgi:hypothetical protein
MAIWNLLDGGPSRKGALLRPSESLRGGTLGTNPSSPIKTYSKIILPRMHFMARHVVFF